MAFPLGTIKLAAAQNVFQGAEIKAHEINEEVTHYSIAWNGHLIEAKSLTAACQKLWAIASKSH